ncbi:hypothetical protein B0H16DRAFT_373812 [Mycena metata]|uniref:RNase III domain-containing protein n=1 Tax=Mycena metata TaxID=1033252 RepID=A0AAD7NMU4_9AGAR|nr:hypothetical protein B0H16DRAFT_373812 [Mycena metata]
MARTTPMQAIAHLLEQDNSLRDPIPTRQRVSLAAPPHVLLRQLDNEKKPLWPPLELLARDPQFPHNYPPNIPAFTNHPERLCLALTARQNKPLEWLGDAVVEAVLFCRLYDSDSKACAPVNNDCVTPLVNTTFLGHLGLLYGIQLHDVVPRGPDRRAVPSVARVCNSFEAVVGASMLEFGFADTEQWLGGLLDPWVQLFAPTSAEIFLNSDARTKYITVMRRLGASPLAQLRPVDLSVDSFLENPLSNLLAVNISRQLGASGPAWVDVDVSGIVFPPGYPPSPPRLADVAPAALSAAMTDATYHTHFGSVPNTGYGALGLRLCKLAVTALIVTRFDSASPEEKVILRAECLDEGVIARLGLVLNLHRHLRVVRSQEDETHYITALESKQAFEALVGAVYVAIGWTELFVWLEKLFMPWIQAANDGGLRSSAGAEGWRREREAKNAIKVKTLAKPRPEAAINAKKTIKLKTASRIYATDTPPMAPTHLIPHLQHRGVCMP